jgi:hypothetical protein
MRRIVMLVGTVAVLVAGLAFVAPPASATVTTSANLIHNGNGERDTCGDGYVVVAPKFWTTGVGTPTNVCWTNTGGFPSPTDPGPKSRGLGFFAGGNNQVISVMRQAHALTAFASAIAAGHATYKVSGFFGGWSSQNDNAKLTVTFVDASKKVIGTPVVIGAVKAADRNSVTGLFLRSGSGSVPTNAATVRFAVTFTRTDGSYNDGYADNLSFQVVTS